VAAASGAGRWSAPLGTTVTRSAAMPIAMRSAATSRDGTTNDAPDAPARASAASCQRSPRRVVASGWRRHATSWTVTTSRAPLERRSRGQARDTECTMSKPSGAWDKTVVPGHGEEPPGEPRRDGRSPEGGERVAPGTPRRPAGQERHPDLIIGRRIGGQPAEEAARVDADAAGHAPAELLDGQEHGRRRSFSHGRPPRRG